MWPGKRFVYCQKGRQDHFPENLTDFPTKDYYR